MMDAVVFGDGAAVLAQLRAYLAQTALPADSRLPPERALSRTLGVSPPISSVEGLLDGTFPDNHLAR